MRLLNMHVDASRLWCDIIPPKAFQFRASKSGAHGSSMHSALRYPRKAGWAALATQNAHNRALDMVGMSACTLYTHFIILPQSRKMTRPVELLVGLMAFQRRARGFERLQIPHPHGAARTARD